MRIGRLAVAVLLASGCANEGAYELRWSVGGAEPAESCPVDRSTDAGLVFAESCAANGLDIVVVFVVRGEGELCEGEVVDVSDYPCTAGCGKQTLIEAGTYDLCVEALSPAGERLTGVTVVPGVKIHDGDTAHVSVDLPAVAQCQNGLDDDGDGRIDLEDPECSDPSDVDE